MDPRQYAFLSMGDSVGEYITENAIKIARGAEYATLAGGGVYLASGLKHFMEGDSLVGSIEMVGGGLVMLMAAGMSRIISPIERILAEREMEEHAQQEKDRSKELKQGEFDVLG